LLRDNSVTAGNEFNLLSAEAAVKGLVGTNTLGAPRDIDLYTGSTPRNGISMQFYNDFGAGAGNLSLPRVESNKETRYESWATASIDTTEYVKF